MNTDYWPNCSTGERVMPQGARVSPTAPKKGKNMEFFQKHKKIILIVLIVLFIELSGYGILASLSRLLNAL
tara:strand:+ start:104 stop:316 length:213 start_codon:yes stop_codon:yes gene_type:complete